MTSRAKNPVRTLEKSFAIVKGLQDLEQAGITELADHVGLGVSLVHNHLSTLQEHGYVVKEGDEYRLSLKFLKIGNKIQAQKVLYKYGKEEVKQLAENTGELANMAVEERNHVVDLYKAKGAQSMDNNAVLGQSWDMHCTSLGKAILAHLSEERVNKIIDRQGLPAKTANTIADRGEFFEELETVRERGYAIDDEEKLEGARCVGAPIKNQNGEVLGAVSVSGPRSRMSDERIQNEVSEQVLDAVNVIELDIRHNL